VAALSLFQVAAIMVVVLVVGFVLLRRRSSISSNPQKAARWRALPMRYKLCCWFGVTPLFLSSVLLPAVVPSKIAELLAFVALGLACASMVILEIRVIAWYRANGLLENYGHDSPP